MIQTRLAQPSDGDRCVMLSCNRVVEGSGLQNRCGEIPVAGSNPADSSKSGVVHEWLMWAPC